MIRPLATARIAGIAHTSRATVERARELRAKAPEEGKRVLAGEVQGSKALAAVRSQARHALADQIRAQPPPPGRGRQPSGSHHSRSAEDVALLEATLCEPTAIPTA